MARTSGGWAVNLETEMHEPLAARRDWNVVVTGYDEGWKPAKRILGEAGVIAPTDYHDVLVMKVEDPRAFTARRRGLTEGSAERTRPSFRQSDPQPRHVRTAVPRPFPSTVNHSRPIATVRARAWEKIPAGTSMGKVLILSRVRES